MEQHKEVPKSGTISRLKNAPKDLIPLSKTPRRQRSSRFHVTERVELEKLPNFKGKLIPPISAYGNSYFLCMSTCRCAGRQDLFIKKLNQCCVLFDFNDSMADLKGKEIKRQTLTELVEYITSNRGVITEAVYPDIIKMVAISLSTTPMATHVFS